MVFKRKITEDTAAAKIHYMGVNARLFCAVVDTSLVAVILWLMAPLLFPIIQYIYVVTGVNANLPEFSRQLPRARNFYEVYMLMQAFGIIGKLKVDALINLVSYGAYIIPFWYFRGATPGKMLLRARIADAKTMERPALYKLVIRYLACIVSVLPLFLGLLIATVDGRRRAFHDRLAGTVVVYNQAPLEFLKRLPLVRRVGSAIPTPRKMWDFYRRRSETHTGQLRNQDREPDSKK